MKISVFSLIILDRISEFWQAFDASKFNSFLNYLIFINVTKRKLRVLFAYFSYDEHTWVITFFVFISFIFKIFIAKPSPMKYCF